MNPSGAGKDEKGTPSSSPAKETSRTTRRKAAQATKGGKKNKKGTTKTQASEEPSPVDGHEVDEKTGNQTVEEEEKVTESTAAKEEQVISKAAKEWRSSLEDTADGGEKTVKQKVETEERVAERMTRKRPLEGGGVGEVVAGDETTKRTKEAAENDEATPTPPPLTTTATPARVTDENNSTSSSSHNKVEVWLRGVPVDATSDDVKDALGRNSWVIKFHANQAGDAKLELTGEDSEKAVTELLSESTIMIKGTSVEAYCPGAAPPVDKVENEEVLPSAASWTVDSSIGGEDDLTTLITPDTALADVSPDKSGGGGGGGAAPPAAKTPQVAVLRLRGLPYSATLDGVKAFFSGVQLADGSPVHFILNHHGRPSGEVRREVILT